MTGDDAATTRRRLLAGAAGGLAALAGCAASGPAETRITVDPADRSPLSFAFGYGTGPLGGDVAFDDPGVRGMVADSGAQVLRFPGPGGNLYDWEQDALLAAPLERSPADVLDRDAFESAAAYDAARESLAAYRATWRDRLAADAGYDFEGYLAVTGDQDVDRVLVLNLSTAPDGADPVDHAAGWVRDLADRGVAVGRFELGTNLYGPARFFNGFDDPARYREAAARVARVVRERFPDAAVAVSAAPPLPDDDRAAAFDDAVDGPFDAVAMPTTFPLGYRDGRPRSPSGGGLQTTRREALRTSARRPARLAAGMDEQFPETPVWMTETGTTAAPGYGGTVLQALVEVDYLLHWLDHAATAPLYCRHRLFGDGGTVTTADGERYATPLFDAYGVLAEGLATATHVVGATTEAAVRTDTPKPEPWASLTVRALLDEPGSRIFVAFVNKGGSSRRVAVERAEGSLPTGDRMALQFVTGGLGETNGTGEDGATLLQRSVPVGQPFDLPPRSAGILVTSL